MNIQEMEAAQIERKNKNAGQVHINNASLPAGAPMYYYCQDCDDQMRLPESHREPAPRRCARCKALRSSRV